MRQIKLLLLAVLASACSAKPVTRPAPVAIELAGGFVRAEGDSALFTARSTLPDTGMSLMWESADPKVVGISLNGFARFYSLGTTLVCAVVHYTYVASMGVSHTVAYMPYDPKCVPVQVVARK